MANSKREQRGQDVKRPRVHTCADIDDTNLNKINASACGYVFNEVQTQETSTLGALFEKYGGHFIDGEWCNTFRNADVPWAQIARDNNSIHWSIGQTRRSSSDQNPHKGEMMKKSNTEKNQRIKLLIGATYVTLFLSGKELDKLTSDLKSKASDWTSVINTAGEQIDLRISQVMMIEHLQEQGPALHDDTIPISHLAEFAGVAPITITRLFPETLKSVSGKTDKYRRATKDTAMALRTHLLKSGREGIKSEREFNNLFGKERA
jgi:hypothetical protein